MADLKIISEDEENRDLTLEETRKSTKLFMLIEEVQQQYYMDLNGKKYQPE